MLRKNDNIKVTFYKNKRSKHGIDISLFDALSFDEYKQTIERLRTCEYHSNEYDSLKNDLPIFTTHATFAKGAAKTNYNATANGVLCVDIDYQDNKELIDNCGLVELKYQLINVPSVIAVALSCGGRGIMVFHRLDDNVTHNNFINYFNELKTQYKKSGIVIDDSCKNIARQRYVSYDDDVLINDVYEPYSLKGIEIIDNETNIVNNNVDTTYHNWKINPKFDINNYTINTTQNIEGFSAIRRKWLATTIKRFFNENGLQLAIDIYKAYPNSVVKVESIEHLRAAYKERSACVRTIAVDLVKLGILIENKTEDKHVFNLNENEYLSDVIEKIKFNVGFNLLVAGTGYGKTEVWKRLADDTDVSGMSKHNILVCEPRNSIIVSKYIDERYEQVYGDKKFPTTPNGLVVTNYDKLISRNVCKNFDWFNYFEYFVIDESHLLFSEAYRDNSVMRFIDLLMNIKDKTKIIFQTATPTDEDDMFDIPNENVFYVNKTISKKTEIEYINCFGDPLYNAETIARNALDKHEYDKVFIYNGTGSVVNDEALKHNLTDKYNVLVYHRKTQYKDVMSLFDEQHTLSIRDGMSVTDYDIFISSTAASVGIDINDDCRVLVIIIGNITFEEEMQVAGRFRNCDDMKIEVLISYNTYNTKDWKTIRHEVFNALDNTQYNNEIIDSNVINNQSLYGVRIGNIRTHEDKKLKYFQIKNNVLRSAMNYKINKYKKYNWKLIEMKKNNNIFEILKHVDDFILGQTKFKITKHDKYRDVNVDDCKTYRLYGDNEHGFVLCKKFYEDDYIEQARAYRKNYTETSNTIKEKLLTIIIDGKWDDKYYSYKNDYPLIEGWLNTIVKCNKYYNHLFKLFDNDTLMNDWKKLYVIMRFIEFTQHVNYDWVEWYVIKLCRENKQDINMCGYAYLLWCLFATNDKNKLMKTSYYDSFHNLFNVFVNDVDDELFKEITRQIENNETSVDIDFDKLNETNDDIFNIIETKQTINVIDVMYERLHKSNYYTKQDIVNLVNHINDDAKQDVCNSYNAIYKRYVLGENHSKKIVIAQKLPDKYKVNVGDTFNSCSDLAKILNIRTETVTRWKKRGFITQT